MGCGMCHHAHLHLGSPTVTCALTAINAWHTMVMQQFSPRAVSKNCQFGDDLVERCTALATQNGHHLIFDIEIEIDTIVLLGTQTKSFPLGHASFFQQLHPLP